jgi:sugar phosphate permease
MLLPVGRSGLAIAAGYAGLFALLIVPAPLALVLGLLAVRDIKKNPKKHGMGRAVFGIVMGALGTAVLTFFAWSLATGR